MPILEKKPSHAIILILTACCIMGAMFSLEAKAQSRSELRFDISFPESAHREPITGRIYVMISRRNERAPRLQISQTGGTPFFGRDVEKLRPGQSAFIDETDLGSPVPSLRRIPAGDYFVQAFINIYSEFRRADGHVVWMHDDRWEGQRWNISPGNLYSKAQKIHLEYPRHLWPGSVDGGAEKLLRAGLRHERQIGPPNGHLVGCVWAGGRRWLLQTLVR